MTGLGSGFILSSDGFICTNYHVVKGVDKASVKIDAATYNATIVGYDELTVVFLGDSNAVKVGDWAVAIGNPFGLDRTFTVGVISAVGRRDVDMTGGSQTHIQTDASINPGNSLGHPALITDDSHFLYCWFWETVASRQAITARHNNPPRKSELVNRSALRQRP